MRSTTALDTFQSVTNFASNGVMKLSAGNTRSNVVKIDAAEGWTLGAIEQSWLEMISSPTPQCLSTGSMYKFVKHPIPTCSLQPAPAYLHSDPNVVCTIPLVPFVMLC
mmetsp:Transcript_7286/g.19089  ORF Transcript_7286/g.19089 Transcript_7286/m.19089 type:complete len:108 (-) Transcript_7286:2026-2349(-)